MSFRNFKERSTAFRVVDDWMQQKKIILIVDELNIIPPEADGCISK
jgi:hypothetical protein